MKSETKNVFLSWCILIILIIGAVFFTILIDGCTPLYQQCTSVDVGRYRCQGTKVQQCNGDEWAPQRDCATLTINGEATPRQCVAEGDRAFCGGE